jgi:NADH-quinone oxidoreductase subunit J
MTPLALLPAALALALCLVAVTRPNVVHALIWLVAALLSLAASFFALGAGFAGAVQILIYAGAIMAVFVFVVMTVDSAPSAIAAERERIAKAWPLPAIAAAGLFAALAVRLGPAEPAATATGGAVPAREVGALLFGPWAVAVEISGFLLLAALLGARHLGRRPTRDTEGEAP